ncbi:hypothetical protein [Nocardioides sp. SYSU D00038]|uniref:hypothetical protein n=1 Tax=Nocardioides sp. SYSU D00038 TaxID=2812554 RepID=UPI00196717E7|nr:hypothetical protein [Nocardioides sp. SYSU D00038]
MPAGATVIGKVAIKVVPDTGDFRREAEHDLDRIERQIDELRVSIVPDISSPALRQVRGQLNVLSRRRAATIAPTIDQAAAARTATALAALSGGRGLANIGSDFGEYIGNLDRALPKIAATNLALANLASSALTSSANLLSLSGSLASTAGAALALPGIFGGMAIGLGASVAVLRDFNTVLPEVKEELAATQDRMSARFWAVAEAPIRNLVTSLLPQFSRGLESASESLGGFFGNLASSATGIFDGQLDGMFDDLGSSINIASGYTDQFVGVLAKLGDVGAGNLPRLATWFGEITTDFDNWLAEQGPDGLQRFVDQGVIALQDLGGVVANTGGILSGLAEAAEESGASTLATLRATTQSIEETVNGPTFQNALRNTFRGAREGLDELTDRSGEQFEGFMLRLADVASKALPKAGKAAGTGLGAIFDTLDQPSVQTAALGFFDDLNTAVEDIAPSLPKVADGLAELVDAVGQVGTNLSRALGTALDDLSPTFGDLLNDLEPLIDQLGDGLVNAVELATPVVDDLAGGVGVLASAVADVLAPVNGFIDLIQKAPAPVRALGSELVAIGAIVAGTMWLGSAARLRVTSFADSLVVAGTKAKVAEGAFLSAGVGAENFAARMTRARLGLVGAGLAVGTLGTEAAGSNKALSVLASTAGGALVGSAFGPLGTAIGAAGGALVGLVSSAGAAGDALTEAKPPALDFASTLDQITGAATRATHEMAYLGLSQTDAFKSAADLGIGQRELVNALVGTGQEGKRARAEIDGLFKSLMDGSSGLTQGSPEWEEWRNDVHKVRNALADVGYELKEDQVATRALASATAPLSELYRGFPKEVITRIQAEGQAQTLADVDKIIGRYKLTPKQVRTLVTTEGVKATKAEVDTFIKQLRTTDRLKVRPKVEADVKGADDAVKRTKGKVEDIGKLDGVAKVSVKDNATKPLEVVTKKLVTYNKTIVTATAKLRDNASTALATLTSRVNALDGRVINITTNHRTAYSSTGTPGGKKQGGPLGGKRAGEMVAELFSEGFEKRLEKLLDRVNDLFEKRLDKAGKKGAAAIRKRFGDEVTAYRELAKQHEKLMNQYDVAKDKLDALIEQQKAYREQVTATVVATSDPTSMGVTTYAGIVRGLEDARNKAVKFRDVIKQLIKDGLNKTTLQQILAAGPQAGLAVAESILNGGVGQVNDLQAEIDNAAAGVGAAAGQTMFGDLVASAQNDVDKLISQLGPLQQRLRKFATDLIKALNDQLKKELGNGAGGNGINAVFTPASPTRGKVAGPVNAPTGGAAGSTYVGKQLNYYAAPGSSISTEEDFFAAAGRARGDI